MVDMPCMRDLIKLTGVEKKAKKDSVKIRGKPGATKKTQMPMSKATNTALIKELFEEIFSEQIDDSGEKDKKLKAPR